MDLFRKPRRTFVPPAPADKATGAGAGLTCPDCGAPNAPEAEQCAECNHPLIVPETLAAIPAAGPSAPAARPAKAPARPRGPAVERPERPERAAPTVTTWGYRPPRGGDSAAPGWLWIGIGLAALVAVLVSAIQIATAPKPIAISGATRAQLAEAESLRVVLRADTSAVEPNVALGNLYYDTNNFEGAIPYYLRALRKDPTLTDVRVDLGVAYHNAGDANAARHELEEAVRVSPEHAVAHFDLGVVYQALGLKDRAREEFLKARALPHPPEMEHAVDQLLKQLAAGGS